MLIRFNQRGLDGFRYKMAAANWSNECRTWAEICDTWADNNAVVSRRIPKKELLDMFGIRSFIKKENKVKKNEDDEIKTIIAMLFGD